jgi:hypothetical protein
MHRLSLLLVFAQALWIDVPFIQQDKNGCGSASIWMVMAYWNQAATPNVEEIQSELYSKEAGGVFARDMEKYLRLHGYRVFTFRGEWTDLEQHISKGRPLIVCLEKNARGVPLHYVVVTGVDPLQNLVLVNDPAQRKLLSVSRQDFERDWKATENWTMLAVPEIELASVAFRSEKLEESKEYLRSILRSAPSDAYTNEFLATVYFLQDNTESALKYWNRSGKPLIEDIQIDPPLQTNPVLLDRAFTFSRGSLLTLEDFRTTQARLDGMDVLSQYHMQLSPTEGGRFNLTLGAAERNGPGFLSWLRGLPYETLYPEFSNISGTAVNVRSIFRWDSNKRRVYTSIRGPLAGNPKWRFGVDFDARRENWANPAGSFQMRKVEAAAQIHSIPNGRWNWTSGAAVSRRTVTGPLSQGFALKYFGSVTRTLLRNSDAGFVVDSSLMFDAGKLLLDRPARFGKIANSISARWTPFAERQGYEMNARFRAGKIFGVAPFDESFVVGLERDSDLWLRGHSATLNGLKDSTMATRSFFLTNWDFQKALHRNAFFRLSAGPFLDTARLQHSSNWSFDTGLQLRVTVLGSFTLNLSYGKSLSDGRTAFFAAATR